MGNPKQTIAGGIKQALLSVPEFKGKVFEVAIQNSEFSGEGTFSDSNFATVTFESEDSKGINLFVKTKAVNGVQNAMVNEVKAFENEAVFYMGYLPVARKLLESKGKGDLIDKIYPKCYYADETITIVENLVGYELVDKVEQQNLEETKVSLTTLAIHHAISNAVIFECKGATEFFSRFKYLNLEPYHTESARLGLTPLAELGVRTCIKMLQKIPGNDVKEAIAYLEGMKGRTFYMVLESLKWNSDDAELRVLNHGDFWNNNMMFLKNQDKSKILSHKALDLQLTRYISPAVDIAYFMFTSVKPEIRRENMESLLKFYLEQLHNTAASIGCPIELKYEELHREFRKRFKYGYMMGLSLSAVPGYIVFNDIDVNDDTRTLDQQLETLMNKWIDENPVKVGEMAENLVKLVQEFNQLNLGANTT